MTRTVRDLSAISPLARLIQESQSAFYAEHGVRLTYGGIARRTGSRLTRTRVHQMATAPIKAMPTPGTVRLLAAGLGVPEMLVTQRALASSGYLVPTDWHVSPASTGSAA